MDNNVGNFNTPAGKDYKEEERRLGTLAKLYFSGCFVFLKVCMEMQLRKDTHTHLLTSYTLSHIQYSTRMCVNLSTLNFTLGINAALSNFFNKLT